MPQHVFPLAQQARRYPVGASYRSRSMTEIPILLPPEAKYTLMFVINQNHMTGTSTLLKSLDELQPLRSGRDSLK